MTIADLTLPFSSEQGFYYEAWGLLQGAYKPQSKDGCTGVFITPDGSEFASGLKGGKQGKLKRALEQTYTPLVPEQILSQPSDWLVFPKMGGDGRLWLTLARFFKTPHPKDHVFQAIGLLEQQKDGSVVLLVPCNPPDPNCPDQPPRCARVQFKGHAPGIEVGQPVQIVGHREGTELVADNVQLVTSEWLAHKQQEKEAAHQQQRTVDRQRSALEREARGSESQQPQQLEQDIFQAIVCIEGRFTAQADDLRSGLLTTPDGLQFPCFFGRAKLREKLLQNYGEIEPEQPFPAQAIVWFGYPRLLKESLSLTLIGVRSERYFLEPEQMKVQGVVIAKSEEGFRLRVYRNVGRLPTESPTAYSDLELKGQLPQEAKLSWTYRVLAHREGTEFVVDAVEPIYIPYAWPVKKAIRYATQANTQLLKPSPPPAPPIRVTQEKAVQPDAARVESPTIPDVAVSFGDLPTSVEVVPETVAPPVVAPVTTVEPEPATESPKTESATTTPIAEAFAIPAAKSKKKKQAALPVVVPVEPQPVAAPQPETSTIPVPGGSANAINTPTDPPAAVPNPPAVPAAKSKKKKQATAPTPAATVPTEKKPEATQPPKPKFLVQVDRQTFGGQASVVLKAGMLLIDGKPIVRTKLAIVVGEPQQVSADGKTQKSGNRTILSSR